MKNPLINPCLCKGSMRLIHLKCLQGWLTSKRTRRRHAKSEHYTWRNTECELCHTVFPSAVNFDGMELPLYEVENLEPPCIMLESIPHSFRREKSKHAYYANLAGRTHFRIVSCA